MINNLTNSHIIMPLNCWSLASRVPRLHFSVSPPYSLIGLRGNFAFNKTHFVPRRVTYCSLRYSSVSSSPVKLGSKTMAEEKYSKELEIAVRAVQMACSLCQKVQHDLITTAQNQVQAKDDNSPVTVADWSVQATVSWILCSTLASSNVSIIAEEDVQSLSRTRAAGLPESVVQTVNECLAEAARFGFQPPEVPLDALQVLESISRCTSTRSPQSSTFWALDPVDGTLGFVRGDQYAVALSLIEDGEVVVGVLGCPNYPMRKEWLGYHHRYHRIVSKLTPQGSESWDKGCVVYARKGSGAAWMQPLVQDPKSLVWPNFAKRVTVSTVDNPELATFCEPVEKANSSHSFTAGLAHSVGLR
ncbi:PAP-specific phosphatase HAL2-like [Linum grandiflorum]